MPSRPVGPRLCVQFLWPVGRFERVFLFSGRRFQVHNVVTGRSSTIPHNKAMEQGVYKDFVLSADGRLMAFCGRFGAIHLLSARSKVPVPPFLPISTGFHWP